MLAKTTARAQQILGFSKLDDWLDKGWHEECIITVVMHHSRFRFGIKWLCASIKFVWKGNENDCIHAFDP